MGSSKINLKARIERHSRVLQHNLYAGSRKTGRSGLIIVSFIIIFLLPIYPTFSNFINNTSVTDFYRWDIDESSIISSYFGTNNVVWDGNVFIQSKNSYLQVNAALNLDNRDVSATKEIIEYEVKNGESVAAIAQKFNISRNSIYWANNFDASKVIHPGDIIKVPPVSWLVHEVKSWETLSGLASKYKVNSEDIMRQNLLLSASDLKVGDTIIIPGAIKNKPKPKPRVKKIYASKKKSGYSFVSKHTSEYVNSAGSFKLVWRKPYSWVWGNCTWYVASYKNVDWRGNANQWMKNAKAKGHAIGNIPTVWAIVQLEWKGYNPRYGHVAIVMDVKSDYIIVSEMNYRRLGEVTTRKIQKNDRRIMGYIYVD